MASNGSDLRADLNPRAAAAVPAGPPSGTGLPIRSTAAAPLPASAAPGRGGAGAPTAVKVIVAGGFGVGKTTFVGAVSEIPPLTTEAALTSASVGVDDTSKVTGKATTTVAMDFGRITLADHNIVLYIFGTPGQDRFWFMWDELVLGAVGAVVLADTRRLADAFPAIDFFEDRGLPFVVACNQFEGAATYPIADISRAIDVTDHPVVYCDARQTASARTTLVGLVRHALETALAAEAATAPGR